MFSEAACPLDSAYVDPTSNQHSLNTSIIRVCWGLNKDHNIFHICQIGKTHFDKIIMTLRVLISSLYCFNYVNKLHFWRPFSAPRRTLTADANLWHPDSRLKTVNQCWFKLVHRLRRWTNVKPTLIQRLVSDGSAFFLNVFFRPPPSLDFWFFSDLKQRN